MTTRIVGLLALKVNNQFFRTSKRALSAHVLNAAEIEFYKKEGYILVRNQLPAEKVEHYNQRFLDIINGKVARPPTMTMMKDISLIKKNAASGTNENTITKIQDFQEEPGIFGYCVEPEILKNVQQLIGDDVYTIHTMYINKPSDLGTGSSRHPPHQDQLYFPFSPEHLICAAWTAMQRITVNNGCLFVKPGSHLGPLLKHEYPNDGIVNKAYHGIQNTSSEGMLNVEMDAGDTLYFHPLLIHGSGPNLSAEFRKAISCHYASSKVKAIDVKGTLQEEMGAEIEAMSIKKAGFKVDFIDIWRMKSAHVAGRPGEAFHLGWRRQYLRTKGLFSLLWKRYSKHPKKP
jgi:phytanoyl-CoA hydroxylase